MIRYLVIHFIVNFSSLFISHKIRSALGLKRKIATARKAVIKKTISNIVSLYHSIIRASQVHVRFLSLYLNISIDSYEPYAITHVESLRFSADKVGRTHSIRARIRFFLSACAGGSSPGDHLVPRAGTRAGFRSLLIYLR